MAMISFLIAVSLIVLTSAQASWRPPGQAEINQPGEPTYIETPGDGVYNHTFYLVADRKQLVVEIKACSGALMEFATQQRGNLDKPILILEIGAEDNTRMKFIAPGSSGPPLVSTGIRHPLHCNQFRRFWMSWYDQDFRVGRGSIVGKQTLMNWRDNSDQYVNIIGLSSEIGSSAVWMVSENSASHQTVYTTGEYQYTTMWKSVEDRHFWSFAILAFQANAYVLLSEGLGGTDGNVYEFGVGVGPSKDRVFLRTEVGGQDGTIKAEVQVADVIVSNGLKEFWICWYRGQIELGRGGVYGKRRLLLWKDPAPLNVRYLSIDTGSQSAGRWLLEDTLESVNYLYTTPTTSTSLDVLYNSTWIEPCHEYFSIYVIACQEASIVLSKDLEVYPSQSVEIVVGALGNTKTLIRYVGQTNSLMERDTPGILNCNEGRYLWMSWHNGTVRLGRGVLFSLDVVLDVKIDGLGSTWSVGGVGLATRTSNGEWRVQESNGERVIVRTPPVFSDFSHYWRTMTQQNFLVFRVKACSDCHVAMSPTLGIDPAESYYDLVISGNNNQVTLLHEVTGANRVVIGDEVATPGLLNCNHHVDLWVEWEGRTITMGRGSRAGRHVLFKHKFNKDHFPIKAVSFSTGNGNSGDFIVNEDCIRDM